MKPTTNSSDDSLINGMDIPSQSQEQTNINDNTNATGFQQVSQPTTTDQLASSNQETQNVGVNPFSNSAEPSNETLNPFSSSFGQSNTTPSPEAAATPSITPTAQQTEVPPQNTSSLDPPPSPASPAQPTPSTVNLENAMVQEKPKRKVPAFLIILLILVILVLGAVGYLAFQNYQMGKDLTQTPTAKTTLIAPPTAIPTPGYTVFQSKILPIEFMMPSGWTAKESEDTKLADQKIIDATSPDFSYNGGSISAGFEFKVGPVNNLTKKYQTFDAFSAEENPDNLYIAKTINNTQWLVSGNEAKTLINTNPLTVALYSSADNISYATEIFNNILQSFKLLNISPTQTPTASPSAIPLD